VIEQTDNCSEIEEPPLPLLSFLVATRDPYFVGRRGSWSPPCGAGKRVAGRGVVAYRPEKEDGVRL